jgi:hypothetical protein
MLSRYHLHASKPFLSRLKSLLAQPNTPIILLLVINLLVGVRIVRDYGESWDETLRYQYAGKELAAYTRKINPANDEKGPAFVMLARLGADTLHRLYPGLQTMQAWHFMNFLAFQLGLFSLYLIARRFLSPWSSLTVVALFGSQPLLWGHAFINPKDIPFMAFFAASIAFGLQMVDSIEKPLVAARPGSGGRDGPGPGFVSKLLADWSKVRRKTRPWLILLSAVSLGLLVGMVVFHTLILDLIRTIIQQAYAADPHSRLGGLFSRLAANANTVSVDLYVLKGLRLYGRFQLLYSLIGLILNLGLAVWFLPEATGWIWRCWIGPGLRWTRAVLLNGNFWLACLLLGLTTSIRVLGPAAGLLVGGYFFLKLGWKLFPVLVAYFLLAAVFAYYTWPDLWGAPLAKFIQDLTHSTDFSLDGTVTFAGVQYEESALPWRYLPLLLSFQFTEPVEFLFALGMGLVVLKAYQGGLDRRMLALVVAWFFIPTITTILLGLSMYDNFRHFLFVIPALFLIAGVGIQALYDRLAKFALVALVGCLLILPGIYWDLVLHPYQYVYYNSFVGGLRGAFRFYEMDFWAVSYREAALYLNQNASNKARVIVWGPDQIVKHNARPDLRVEKYREDGSYPIDSPAYAVLLTRRDKDIELFPQAEIVFQVGRQGAIFCVVKRLDASALITGPAVGVADQTR